MLKRVEEIQGLGLWLRIRLVSQYIKNWILKIGRWIEDWKRRLRTPKARYGSH